MFVRIAFDIKYRKEKISCGMLAISTLGIRPPGHPRASIMVCVFTAPRPDVQISEVFSSSERPRPRRPRQRARDAVYLGC